MNVIDIIVLGVFIVGIVLGIFGKMWKKVINMIMMIVSIPVSYLISGWLMGTAQATKIVEKIKSISLIKSLCEVSPSLESMVEGSPRILLFYIVGLIDFFIFGLIGLLLYFIFSTALSSKKGPTKAVYLFGLPGGISALVIVLFAISPIMVLSPILTETNAYLSTIESPNKTEKTILKVTNFSSKYISTSKVCIKGIELLDDGKIPFLTYETKMEGTDGQVTTRKYSFYSDMKDLGVVFPALLSSVNEIKNIDVSKIDVKDKTGENSLSNFLDEFTNLLKNLDDARAKLKEDGHIKGISGEIISYYLTKKDYSSSNLTFLTYTKNYLEGKDNTYFENCSLRDDILPLIIQSYVDSMEGDYLVLKYVDLTSLSLDQLKSEISNYLADLMSLFDTKNVMSKEDINQLLTSNSVITGQIITGMISNMDYASTTVDLYKNKDATTMGNEAKYLADFLNYANNTSSENESLLTIASAALTIEELTKSKIIASLINTYKDSDKPFQIHTSIYEALNGYIELKYTTNQITLKEKDAYKSLFVA